MADKKFFTEERRHANTKLIIDQLSEIDSLDFNSVIFAFADIIHSSFIQGLYVGKSKEEREQIQDGIVNLNNDIIDVFNSHQSDMRYDMVVLSNLIMDAVEMAAQKAMEAKTEEPVQ